MRSAALFVLLCASFAGCSAAEESPRQEAAPPVVGDGAWPGLAYECPDPSSACTTTPNEFVGYGVIAVAVRDDPPALAALGQNLGPNIAAGGVRDPANILFMSHDGGATWQRTLLPAFPGTDTLTGERSLTWGDIEFGPTGALHLAGRLADDVHRSLVGGNAVPAELNSRYYLGVATTDDGVTWRDVEILAANDMFYFGLTPLPGHIVAHWWSSDASGPTSNAAWSTDGSEWRSSSAPGDCRVRQEVRPAADGALLACLDSIYAFDADGAPQMYRLSPDRMERIEPVSSEPLPACQTIQLLGQDGGYLLVLGGCPDIVVLSSVDGVAWMREGSWGPEAFGDDGWGDEGLLVHAAMLDAHHALHLVVGASRMDATGVITERQWHAVAEPDAGKLLHLSGLATYEPASDGGLDVATQWATYTTSLLVPRQGGGLVVWAETGPSLTAFTVGGPSAT